ncbi:hypothetical protein Nmel_008192, partial [Mimus melanotis]
DIHRSFGFPRPPPGRPSGNGALGPAGPAEGAGVPAIPAAERGRAGASRSNLAPGFEVKAVAGGGSAAGSAAAGATSWACWL